MTSTPIELHHLDQDVDDEKTTPINPMQIQDSIPDFGSFWISSIFISFPRLRKGALLYCFGALIISCVREVFFSLAKDVGAVVVQLIIFLPFDLLNLYLVWKYQLYQHQIQSWFLLFTLPLAPITRIIFGAIPSNPFRHPYYYGDWFLGMCGFASVLALLIGTSFWKQSSQLLQYLFEQEKSNPAPSEPNANGVPLQSSAQETIQTPAQIYAHGEPPPYTVFVPETDHIEANPSIPGGQRPISDPILKSPDSVLVPVSSEVYPSNPSTSSDLVSSSTVTEHASTSKQ